MGRWLTQDPLGYVNGLSLYEYCMSNPVSLSDPYGLCKENSWYNSAAVSIGEFGIGLIEAVYDTEVAIGNILAHPADTIGRAAWNALEDVYDVEADLWAKRGNPVDALGELAWNSLEKVYDIEAAVCNGPLFSADPAVAGHAWGYLTGQIELALAASEFMSATNEAISAKSLSTANSISRGRIVNKATAKITQANVSNNPVKPYEVGTADALKVRSVPGDDISIHHVGQSHPMEQLIPGYNRNTAPTIALPKVENQAIPTIRGETNLTPRQVLANDIRNLRKYTNVPNSSSKELIKLNKQMYPGAFTK